MSQFWKDHEQDMQDPEHAEAFHLQRLLDQIRIYRTIGADAPGTWPLWRALDDYEADLYEAAAFYRPAALSGETVTGHEYDAAFDYWDDTDFSNVNPDDYYGAGQLSKAALGPRQPFDGSCGCLDERHIEASLDVQGRAHWDGEILVEDTP